MESTLQRLRIFIFAKSFVKMYNDGKWTLLLLYRAAKRYKIKTMYLPDSTHKRRTLFFVVFLISKKSYQLRGYTVNYSHTPENKVYTQHIWIDRHYCSIQCVACTVCTANVYKKKTTTTTLCYMYTQIYCIWAIPM